MSMAGRVIGEEKNRVREREKRRREEERKGEEGRGRRGMENVATPRLPIGSADDAMTSPNHSIPLHLMYSIGYFMSCSFAVISPTLLVLFDVRLFLLALLILRGSMRPGLVCMFSD